MLFCYTHPHIDWVLEQTKAHDYNSLRGSIIKSLTLDHFALPNITPTTNPCFGREEELMGTKIKEILEEDACSVWLPVLCCTPWNGLQHPIHSCPEYILGKQAQGV